MQHAHKNLTSLSYLALLALFVAALFPTSMAEAKSPALSPVIKTDWSYPKQVGYKDVAPKATMPKPQKFLLIDSRPYEGRYVHGYIPTAISLPDSAFDKKAAELLPKDKNAEIIFYCQGVDCTLSHQSAFKAEKMGYTKIGVYTGGLPDWLANGEPIAVGVQFVKQMMEKNEPYILVDSRPVNKFVEGSVPTAISIPDSQFEQRKGMLPADKDMQIVLFCGGFDCVLSHQSAAKAKALGYTKIAIMEAGYPAWKEMYGSGAAIGKKDEGADDGIFSVIDFEKGLKSGKPSFVIVDTRIESEFKAGHLPTSINITNDTLEARMDSLPRDKDVVFICTTGSRAGEAYYMVKDKYPDATNFYYLEASIKFNEDGSYQISPNTP